MRLLLASDIHRDEQACRQLVDVSSVVDVTVIAGDLASQHIGLEETIDELLGLKGPTILVPGNNETFDALRVMSRHLTDATVLHGSSVIIDGVTFFGLGGAVPPITPSWSFDLTEQEAAKLLKNCPATVDVLISHSPPFGHVDLYGDRHIGSKSVLDAVELCKPKLVVCGHVHACWEQCSMIGNAEVINAGPNGQIVSIDTGTSHES